MDPIVKDPNDWTEFAIPVAPSVPQTVSPVITPSPKPPVNPPLPEKDPNDWSEFVVGTNGTPPKSKSLSVEDVTNDVERVNKLRKMLSTTKDVYYETAPAEEVVDAFMTHMRWMNTNEVSTGAELINLMSADEETKAVYGDAYRVYDEMGSMFSNGDAWNATLDYAGAFVTSPSTWLGVGIGKAVGGMSSKIAAKKAVNLAVNAAAKQVVKKSAGKIPASVIKSELKNNVAKAAARYHIAGTLATEIPIGVVSDYMYQSTQMEAGVQDEYSYLQGGVAAVAGGLSAIPGIITLRTSSNSVLANTGELVSKSYAARAASAGKRAAPHVKKSLKKAQADWLKLVKAGESFEGNIPLQNSMLDWFFDVQNEDSLVRILQREGAEFSFEEGTFTRDLLRYGLGMGDEALEGFNKAFEPLGTTFGEATEILAATVSRGGVVLNKPSVASKFFQEMKKVAVSRKTANKNLAEFAKGVAANPAKDVDLNEREVLRYLSSTWKKSLVSTFMTTAANVKGWGLARGVSAMSDMFIMGGLFGKGGVRALYDPAAGLKDLARGRAIAQNQVFALRTLVDPFLSAEAFLKLLDNAPAKVKKSVTGQIFGGVEDFSPARFGLNPDNKLIKGVEAYTDFAQRSSFVHLQDTLTKGVTGLTSLDRESRIQFGKGISQLIEDGEAWKLTDDIWDTTMQRVLRETFSEDLSKGTHALKSVAKMIQTISSTSWGGMIMPFGKFLNNTVAFTYRHSPLGLVSAFARVGKKGMDETAEEMFARVAVGSSLIAWAGAQEATKQEEGLQWFERRLDDGSVENISNLFPENILALIGRVGHNWNRGEGGNAALIDELKKQLGPVDVVENAVALQWLKPVVELLTDESLPQDGAHPIAEVIGMAVGGVAAGFTRPLDFYSKTLSHMVPEAGGGYLADPKQAEGMDKVVLASTRYMSGFFNLAFGEEQEDGTYLYGERKQSVFTEEGVKSPNPFRSAVGTSVTGASKNLNKLLGMVDMPPYLAESFTSGLPEFDAYVNKEVTPLLEIRSKSLLNNPVFKTLNQSQKIEKVRSMLNEVESEVLSYLDQGYVGTETGTLLLKRRNYLTLPKPSRIRAKKALKITTKDTKLSIYEIEVIKRWIDYEDDSLERIK